MPTATIIETISAKFILIDYQVGWIKIHLAVRSDGVAKIVAYDRFSVLKTNPLFLRFTGGISSAG